MSESSPSNITELSVSELSAALKRTIETAYDHVRVRGELGRVTLARSGHLYVDLKDDKAVINTIMWKRQAGRLNFRPEEGLEVVATGRLSTYPGRSNYQLIADTMRPAGVGALMALLDERKKKFAAEGLFDEQHKKRLPFLPQTIGVVTSPTGAVIRDILHRVSDRFPVRVILWPVLVQGDRAADQIEAAIRGFNAMAGANRPDVLIVGRGGGSIEDLWPFNEENVVRAAFESVIPLISAVGHETDTTLIDYVSDARAPTPTGAAEIAVPVRSDLRLQIGELEQRLKRALSRQAVRARERIEATRLPRPERLLEGQRQRLDACIERLPRAASTLLERRRSRLDTLSARLLSPKQLVSGKQAQYERAAAGLRAALNHAVSAKKISFSGIASRLRPQPLFADQRRARESLKRIAVRARPALNRILEGKTRRLAGEAKLLDTLSYQATLKRGYAIVKTADGALVRTQNLPAQTPLTISLSDGEFSAVTTGQTAPQQAMPKPDKKTAAKSGSAAAKTDQGSLF